MINTVLTPFYINENEELAIEVTELSLDEIEAIVGRFKKHSRRAGALRGKVTLSQSGAVEIRTCFGNRLLWSGE